MASADPRATAPRRYVLGPSLRFVLVCIAFVVWILVTSILPAGRAENILRGVPKFNPVEAFGTPLLFWLFGSIWILRSVDAVRAKNVGRRELLVIAAIVVALGATIFVGAFFWLLFLASGPTR
jgi:hypothetical protein